MIYSEFSGVQMAVMMGAEKAESHSLKQASQVISATCFALRDPGAEVINSFYLGWLGRKKRLDLHISIGTGC